MIKETKHKENYLVDDKNKIIASKPKTKKRWLIVLIVVILIIAGAAAFWYLGGSKLFIKSPVTDQSIVDKADQLTHNGKTDEALKLYDDAIKNAKDDTQKYNLLMGKATVYFNDGNYSQAMTYAKQAEAVKKNETISYFIAQIYEKEGDKTNAIKYYQKAIEFASKAEPSPSGGQAGYYQEKIKALSGE